MKVQQLLEDEVTTVQDEAQKLKVKLRAMADDVGLLFSYPMNSPGVGAKGTKHVATLRAPARSKESDDDLELGKKVFIAKLRKMLKAYHEDGRNLAKVPSKIDKSAEVFAMLDRADEEPLPHALSFFIGDKPGVDRGESIQLYVRPAVLELRPFISGGGVYAAPHDAGSSAISVKLGDASVVKHVLKTIQDLHERISTSIPELMTDYHTKNKWAPKDKFPGVVKFAQELVRRYPWKRPDNLPPLPASHKDLPVDDANAASISVSKGFPSKNAVFVPVEEFMELFKLLERE